MGNKTQDELSSEDRKAYDQAFKEYVEAVVRRENTVVAKQEHADLETGSGGLKKASKKRQPPKNTGKISSAQGASKGQKQVSRKLLAGEGPGEQHVPRKRRGRPPLKDKK